MPRRGRTTDYVVHARRFTCLVGRLLVDTSGATAIEYSIVAAGIGATVAAAVWSLGTSLQTTFYNKLSSMF